MISDIASRALELALFQYKDFTIARKLMSAGVKLPRKHMGKYALLSACKEEKEEEVKLLLDVGVDIEKTWGDDEETALMVSVSQDNPTIVRMLIEANANIDATKIHSWYHYDYTALMIACEHGIEDIVQLLVDAKAKIEDETVRCALGDGDHSVKIVRILLNAGAELYDSVLIDAVNFNNPNPTLIQMLVDEGADPNATNEYGFTALGHMMDHYERDIDVIRSLIGAGADIEKASRDGNPPTIQVMYTLKYTEEPGTKYAYRKEKDGKIHKMTIHKKMRRVYQDPDPQLLRLFLDAGADVNAIDRDGNTALMIATKKGYTSNIPVLMEAGADPTIANNSGETPRFFVKKDNRSQEEKERDNMAFADRTISIMGGDRVTVIM